MGLDNQILLIGNKRYKYTKITPILDTFKRNVRFNMSLLNQNNGTKCNILVLNNHVYDAYRNKGGRMSNMRRYEKIYNIPIDYQIKFFDQLDSGAIRDVMKQFYQQKDVAYINKVLKELQCPYLLENLPRLGFSGIIRFIKQKPILYGFSLKKQLEPHLYNNEKPANTHDEQVKRSGHDNWNEIDIVKWLHLKGYVDASLCMLKDVEGEYSFESIDDLQPTKEVCELLKKLQN